VFTRKKQGHRWPCLNAEVFVMPEGGIEPPTSIQKTQPLFLSMREASNGIDATAILP
jgi:hypothetical protein